MEPTPMPGLRPFLEERSLIVITLEFLHLSFDPYLYLS